MLTHPTISVVIPVKNGMPEIQNCIKGILSQSIPVEEIVVIDSGSTDGTIKYLQSVNKVKFIAIPAEEFNHGMTRNIGWQHTSSEFVIYTVQDAMPANENWIAELLKGFADTSVIAVCGQQIVDHDKSKNPLAWFSPLSEPGVNSFKLSSAAEFESMSPEDKKKICSWDNVNAMYRRSVLEKIPFVPAVFGEDMIWAKEALLAGYAIAYNYGARVHHYHYENHDFTFRRSFTEMYFRYKHFGYVNSRPSQTLRNRLSMIKTLFGNLGPDVKNIIKWYRYNTACYKAMFRAHRLFINTLRHGEAALDQKHAELCGKPPIPLKSNG